METPPPQIFTEFVNEYYAALSMPERLESSNALLYEKGIQCITTISDVHLREEVLHKMLLLYHDRAELYYYMGVIFEGIDPTRAQLWFHLCFHKNPLYMENTNKLLAALFTAGFTKYIAKLLNTRWDILKQVEDEQFLFIYATTCVAEKNITTSRRVFTRVLECIAQHGDPNNLQYNIYLNMAHMYSLISNIPNSIVYVQKIIQTEESVVNNTRVSTDARYSYMTYSDYIYTDPTVRYEFAKNMNRHYFVEHNYTFPWMAAAAAAAPDQRPLRIGYVSNSALDHAVSNFIIPILCNHDKSAFDVVLFTGQTSKIGNYARNIVDAGVKIVDIHNTTTVKGASIVHDEQIDILIDLDGYTFGNRLDIFSKNPAPIQMTYLGYPNSLGLDFIQYRIVDRITDPPESTQPHSETLVYMPKCFLLYKSVYQTAPFDTPKLLNSINPVVLGALNKQSKNSPEILAAWRAILHSTKNTVLLVKTDGIEPADVAERLEFYKDKLCVGEDRLAIMGYCSHGNAYFDLFQKTDIVLDTFPYSGTTTTCNSLYNSIPVVTCHNPNCHAQSVSASLLTNCGHPELVAHSVTEYVDKVVELCGDIERINEYKRTIGRDFAASMDPAAFMHDYEELLRDVVRTFTKSHE